MIIGLCGNAGVGKDAVADFLVRNHGFVKVALADPLKRICQDVYGFTDEQLWGSSEKRNAPDKRWPRTDRYIYPAAPVGALWYPIGGGRALISESDLGLVAQYTWCANKKEAGKKTAYVRMTTESKKLHQLLLGDAPDGHVIDHINGDGLDNRRENLRFCTHAENHANESKRNGGTSVFKGVGFDAARQKWWAKITVGGQTKNLGRFESEVDAAVAYDRAAVAAFGAHARTNSSLFLTPRYALQTLGTNWGRDCSPDTWVRYALGAAKQLLRDPYLMYTVKEGVVPVVEQTSQGEWQRDDAPNRPCAGVVISDARFRNEIDAIHAAGGKVVRITRKERPDHQGLIASAAAHISETEQKELPDDLFDHHLINEGTSLVRLEVATAGLAAALRTA